MGITTTVAISTIQIATGRSLIVNDLIIDNDGTYGFVSSISGTNAIIETLGSLRGADGTNGTNGITPTIIASATVDSNVGTPSVSVVKTGTDASPTFTFNFTNIKGETGTTTIKTQIVNNLPSTGDTDTIYFVPNNSGESENLYNEYLYINNAWERVDSKIDLSNYIQKSNTSGLVKNDGTIDTNGYVRYDTNTQGLDATQKTNARANIGAGTSDFSGSYTDLSNKPTFASVATSGNYNDLINKPAIPTVKYVHNISMHCNDGTTAYFCFKLESSRSSAYTSVSDICAELYNQGYQRDGAGNIKGLMANGNFTTSVLMCVFGYSTTQLGYRYFSLNGNTPSWNYKNNASFTIDGDIVS